jgi:predicted transcriptional regulator of viral defense system
MAAALRRHEWVTPARGLWVPVPAEYQTWGGPPATEFIDAMMGFMGVEYYVGWLSAAALHGSAHHAPQITQVATSRSIRERTVGRVRLHFQTRSAVNLLPVVVKTVRSGKVRISTPEVTALDLCSDIELAGGMGNVATVIEGLVEESGLDEGRLIATSQLFSPASVRRLGWLMENHTDVGMLDALAKTAADMTGRPSKLDTFSPIRGELDKRWMLRINTEVKIEE